MKCRVLLYSLVALLPSLSSCDDDDKTPPVEPQPTVCPQGNLGNPQQPLVCMVQAMAEQVSADYALTLRSNFVFSPTTDDSLDAAFAGTGAFDNWDKTVESNTVQLLFQETDNTILDIGTPIVRINRPNFVRFELVYSLEVQSWNPPNSLTYRGTAQVDVTIDVSAPGWYVTAWRETEQVPGFSTWGYLRGTLRTQLPSSP